MKRGGTRVRPYITALSLVNFVTGFVLFNANFVLLTSERDSVRATAMALVHLWRAFPPFLLGEGLVAGSWGGAWTLASRIILGSPISRVVFL